MRRKKGRRTWEREWENRSRSCSNRSQKKKGKCTWKWVQECGDVGAACAAFRCPVLCVPVFALTLRILCLRFVSNLGSVWFLLLHLLFSLYVFLILLDECSVSYLIRWIHFFVILTVIIVLYQPAPSDRLPSPLVHMRGDLLRFFTSKLEGDVEGFAGDLRVHVAHARKDSS